MQGRIRQATEAERPVAPSRDRRIPLAAMGGLGGLAFGVLIVALFGLLHRRMEHLEDMDAHERHGRFISLVPDVDDDAPDGGSEMSDYCIHHLRTLVQLRAGERQRTLAITSPSPGSGKTTVGIALGLSFGATGSRTLIVDCDLVGHGLTSSVPAIVCEGAAAVLEACKQFDTLDEAAAQAQARTDVQRAFARKGVTVSTDRIEELLEKVRDLSATGSSRARAAFRALEAMARYQGVNGFAPGRRSGVLDVLNGARLEECALETGFQNLDILPIGEARKNDAERISLEQMQRLAQTCREQYDTVIFDTGPILGSLEASFVAAVSDEVLFVVARGESRKPASDALERLERMGADISGIVFNRAPMNDVLRSSYASRSQSVAVEAM